MIIPLMAFAALAVDVGSWYARTTEMQKAADAAALAGVVWAPDYSKARTVAAKTLTDNGFTATNGLQPDHRQHHHHHDARWTRSTPSR